ncbi:MAG: hypothetical protein ACI9XO_002089 [Paraglaciecola sp.]|jgi:hypothetical protein
MKKFTASILILLCFFQNSQGQPVLWEELSSMPERVSNNAVTAATVDGVPYAFSFSGIDSTKSCGSTHLRSFRYNTETDIWETIAPLPEPLDGKIAAAASTIKNKIYITGGFHIPSGCGETSSAKIHIYDPKTNEYLPNGIDMPKAIDDHVQGVWRDSLLYMITGWSNNTNVTNVQIYNPATDVWTAGTPVPNTNDWKVFGGSGEIVGDTIYYIGGASPFCSVQTCFPPTTFLRRGIINPDNPAEITWEGSENEAAQGYRMAASTYQNNVIWLGGSDLTFNFNGIDYNGTGGVAPNERLTLINTDTDFLYQIEEQLPPIMDLRGMAKISENEYIIAGGMNENQEVVNSVFKIKIEELTAVNTTDFPKISVFPNPVTDVLIIQKEGVFEAAIFDMQGRIILEKQAVSTQKMKVENLDSGVYFLRIFENGEMVGIEKIVKL